MRNSLNHSLVTLCTLISVTASPLAAATAAPERKNTSLSKMLSKPFTDVAKKATPAVVSIRAQVISKRALQKADEMDEGPDAFQEELWRRFFGGPSNPGQSRNNRKVLPAPVAIGSGFIISSDGYILTNNHVVQDVEDITVTCNNGQEFKAKLIGTDPNTDVALLKIDATALPFLELANSQDVEVGEWVIAIGNPFGLQATLTAGHVSGTGRKELDIAAVEEFIQTDASINSGNSGGPLLNLDSEVIGMNTAIASTMAGGSVGIGFAIPSNLIKYVVKELMEHGKVVRGFLGIELQRLDSNTAAAFGLTKTEGALIANVRRDGPADKAGMKAGDIIMKVNGQPIDNNATLKNLISFIHPGDSAALTVLRNGKEMDINVVIGTHPENEINAIEIQNALGLVVQDATPELLQQLGYPEDEKGVIIKSVTPYSPALAVGLRRGQLIFSVNRQATVTTEQFYDILQKRTAGEPILLHVRDGQVTRFVSLKIDS